ncbi:F-box only protein 21-like isoform X2 [Daphnia carinata]|uniref:F-box only protein 21-like isoform X2 n=1 Tax=Daphnia carinata TaxID=120202 RepID=UPI00257DC825|nr:F-box only protein 21-like isoform X2 [Daphnia carinata]
MSLNQLPEEILIRHILSYAEITIFDLQSLMFSCHTLYRFIRNSNELWRLKFSTRWPQIPIQCQERNERIWYERVALAIKAAKEVNNTLQEMSFQCYPLNQSPLSAADKLITGQHPIPECVQHELELMASTINENLTTQYYARDVLTKVKSRVIEHKLQDLMARPESQKSLVEGAALISQWFELGMLKQTSRSDIRRAIDDLTERVKKLTISTVCDAKFSFPTAEACDSLEKAKEILDVIHLVMFREIGFKLSPIYGLSLDHYCSIAEVLETKRGCHMLITIIFQEVARKLGVPLQIVIYGERSFHGERNLLLRWSKYPGEVDADRIYYIDVCAEIYESLKPCHCYQAAMGQPASSAQQVFQQMMSTMLEQLRNHWGSFLNFTGKGRDNDSRLLIRLAIIISPQERNLVLEYANLCLALNLQMDDAAQLLQSVGLQGHQMIKKCTEKVWRQQILIIAAKFVCNRPPTLKYAVGLIMEFKSMPVFYTNHSQPCVIVSWSPNFQKAGQWKTVRRRKAKSVQHQAYYHILIKNAPSGFIGLNVAEETLELHHDPDLAHEQLGSDFIGNGYFERFDGRSSYNRLCNK